MTNAETAFLHRLEHATLPIALHALRRHRSPSLAAQRVIAHRADLLWAVTLPGETTLPLADLWDEAIEHDRHNAQQLVNLLDFMPDLAPHFRLRQLAQYGSDIERLIELAGHLDSEVIQALLSHPALFPWSEVPALRPPPWEVSGSWTGELVKFGFQPTLQQWHRLAGRILVNPTLELLDPYPVLRWLFVLPEPYDPQILLSRQHLRLAAAQHWHTPPALRSALLHDALETQDLQMIRLLLLSSRLQEHEQAAILKVVSLDLRAEALRYGTVTLQLLEGLANDPDLTLDLLDPGGCGYLNYHRSPPLSSERLERTLLRRFGLEVRWAIF